MKKALLILSHLVAGALGVGIGVYLLPILIAPHPPSLDDVTVVAKRSAYGAHFRRDLPGSDFFHWGDGSVFVGTTAVAFAGRIAPGPDYRLYLAPEFVDTREAFLRIKARSARVGDVRTFDNFVVPVPPTIDPARYDTVVVWCEAFSQFITAAKYR